METPVVKLTAEESEKVYEPAEDSFLLIDALEKDLDRIQELRPKMCLEIGSGSGIVITALAMALKSCGSIYFLACDINRNACEVTKNTCKNNAVNVDVIQTDLVRGIESRGAFDIIIFNPPYVVTEPVELFEQDVIYKSWAGGTHGREVMERLFKHVPQLLSDIGVFYLLVIKENDPMYIMQSCKQLGIHGTIVAERKIRGEHLYVLRFSKKL